MPDLGFAVSDAAIDARALTPVLAFALDVTERSGVHVDTVVLEVQIMVEARRRTYDDAEREALLDLFDVPQRWGTTLKTMLWTRTQATVPGFDGHASVSLPVACTYDLTVASAKYFVGLRDGDVPLTFQFAGTVFYRDGEGSLQIERVPWTAEAQYRLPVSRWRELIDAQYPDRAWLGLDRDVFEALHRYRTSGRLATWDHAVSRLLEAGRAQDGQPSQAAAAERVQR